MVKLETGNIKTSKWHTCVILSKYTNTISITLPEVWTINLIKYALLQNECPANSVGFKWVSSIVPRDALIKTHWHYLPVVVVATAGVVNSGGEKNDVQFEVNPYVMTHCFGKRNYLCFCIFCYYVYFGAAKSSKNIPIETEYTVEPLYKGHPRWWLFKRGVLSWGVK